MPTVRKPATTRDDAAAVAAMEHEGGPDPEVVKLQKELADLRAQTDERVKRATEAAKLETRPEDPVQAEVRRLWPLAKDYDQE